MAYVRRMKPGDGVMIDGPAVIRYERRRRRRQRKAEHVLVVEADPMVRVKPLDKRKSLA